jgi:RimJ/RimL family protein N-acetyltransferase
MQSVNDNAPVPVIFETERLIVRPYTLDDGYHFFSVNGDVEIVRYIRAPKTRVECDMFLKEVIWYSEQNPLYGRWAVWEKESGDFTGTFAVIPIENSVHMQLGYSLLKKNWGKGYATELTVAGLEYVINKTPLRCIYAITEAANHASRKVLVKAGFEFHNSFVEGEKELLQYFFLRPGS